MIRKFYDAAQTDAGVVEEQPSIAALMAAQGTKQYRTNWATN
jgi:hypothetical protein